MPILRLIGNLLRLPLVAVLWLATHLGRRPRWVWLRLPNRVNALQPPVPFWQRRLRRGRQGTALARLDRLCDALSKDSGIDGVVVEIPPLSAGWSTLGHMRNRLAALRAADKRVIVYLPRGAGDREMYVAAAAERVLCAPAASVSLLGGAAGGLYLGDALARVGLRAQVVAEGPYKTAAERLTSGRMSDPEREQLAGVLGARQSLVEAALGERIGDGGTPTALFESVSFSGPRAVEASVVDALAYEDEVPAALGQEAPPAFQRATDYERAQLTFFRPLRPPPYLAVVPIHGPITERSGWSPSWTPGGGVETTLAATVGTLRRVRADKRALGVLLHVNSPGGSALVSDLIHHEVEVLARDKPVVAFFADVAASGGYYIPAAAHEIVAAPEAVTGSIGVISLKMVADGLLGKLEVRAESVKSAPHADMMSPARPLSASEEAILRRESEAIYRRFLEVVARGRSRTVAEVESVAGGRVWSARDALAHGLVDTLGDVAVALERLRARVARPASVTRALEPRVMFPTGGPPPPPPTATTAVPGQAPDGRSAFASQAWELLRALGPHGTQCLCPSSLEIYLASWGAEAPAGLSAMGPVDYRWRRL